MFDHLIGLEEVGKCNISSIFWLLHSTEIDKVLQEMTTAKNWPVFHQECKGKENPKLWAFNAI